MSHTITVPDEQYRDALRAMLVALRDRLDDAHGEIEALIAPSADPAKWPAAGDARDTLRDVARTVAALDAMGWAPDERPAA